MNLNNASEKQIKKKSFTAEVELAFSLLLLNTEEPFILVGPDLTVVLYNQQFEEQYQKFFGIKLSKGTSIFNYAQKAKIDSLKTIYEQALCGISTENEIDVFFEGNTKTFLLKYKPAIDVHQQIIGVFVSSNEITEIKKSQELLKANEKRYRALVENGADAMLVIGVDGKISYVSPSVKKVLGYSEEEAIAINFFNTIHPEDLEEVNKVLLNTTESPSQTIQSYTSRVLHKDGSWRWCEAYLTNMIHDPHIGGIVNNFRDVSTRIETEKKLKRAESRFRKLIEHNYDGIVLRDENLSIIYGSSSAERILGWTNEDKLGKDFSDKTHPEDFEKVKENQAMVLQNPGISYPLIFRTKHKAGHFVWVERVMTNMLHDEAINAIVANFRDVTEKIEAEQKRLFDHNNLQALINNTHDLVWSVSTDGKIITSNRAFDEMVLYLSGNPVTEGGSPLNGFPEDQLVKWKKLYERAFTGEIFTVIEHTNFKRENWSEISFYPIHQDHKIIGTACYSRNITERKLSEQKILKNTEELLRIKKELEYKESRLSQAQAIAHVGNWEMNLVTKIATWSDEAYRIYGLQPGDHKFTFDLWKTFIHPEDLLDFEIELEKAQQTLSDLSFKHRIVRPDGTIRYVVSESRYEFNGNGNPIGLYGVVHDVTDQKEFEEKIKESHELLKKLTDKVPVAVYQFEMDAEGNMSFPFMSKAILEINPSIDLYADSSAIFKAASSEDLPQLINSIEESRTKLSDWNLEFRIILEDGSMKWLRGFSKPEQKENGLVVWYGYLEDITERKLAEEKIRIAKERYDFVAKATNDAIYDWDLKTNKTLRTGDGLKTLFGYDPEEAAREKNFWTSRVHPEDYKKSYSILKKSLLNPHTNYCNQEYRFMKADGSYAYVFDKGFIIRDEEGKAIRMIGATQDITKTKEAEFKLQELNEHLEKRAQELALSNTELEQFAYIASHDLQEPLRMVTSFLTLLEKKYKNELDATAQQYIHFATDGAVRMRKLILDLLDYSRVGKQTHIKTPIDINSLLFEAVRLNRNLIDEKKAIINWNSLPIIIASKTSMLQLFQNLIGNALKYQNAGNIPIVDVYASESDDYWQFSVADNGIGIEEKYFEKIFVVFQRLHSKDEFSGTGIGLSICKKIIDNHEGRFWVESNYGKGSTFYFTIPKIN